MLLWVFEQVFPTGLPLTYALGGLQVATVLLLTWLITRSTLDKRRAAIAVLFVSCVTYYTNRLHFYNHNTGLLVAYAMSVYCAFRAAQTQRMLWYALLGVTWGLGLLSKYQMVISIACNVIFLWWVLQSQVRKLIVPLIVSALICTAVITPHVLWLIEHHFPSFDYAAKFVAAHFPWWQRPVDIGGFLADQAMRVVPLSLLLVILRRLPSVRSLGRGVYLYMADTSELAAPLLAIHGWGPLVLMSSLSLLFGVDLQMHWGTAFLWVLPIWFLRTQHGRAIASLPPKTAFTAVALVQCVMLLAYR
jgi:4-amino-4-deoxy-L-arabinose transferase-like glycosyltransferase